MEYKLQARLRIVGRSDIQDYLASEKGLKRLQAHRSDDPVYVGPGETSDVYAIDAVYDDVKVVSKAFDTIQKMMEKDELPGWVAWHECRDEEGISCVDAENFSYGIRKGAD